LTANAIGNFRAPTLSVRQTADRAVTKGWKGCGKTKGQWGTNGSIVSSPETANKPKIARVIGRQLQLPVVSLSAEDAGDHFGFLSRWVSADNPTSSTQTQELVGWRPQHPGLIRDLEEGHYFINDKRTRPRSRVAAS
jgi:hypothetical protein